MSDPTTKDVFDLLVDVRKELNDLRDMLARRPSGGGYSSSSSSSSASQDAGVPQPTKLVDSPGDVVVHFGKNSGKPISELSERSLGWYAQDPEPRLDSAGKPFPPRDADVALRQACRQLWHLRKGTLAGVSEKIAALTSQPEAAKPAAATVDDENIPF